MSAHHFSHFSGDHPRSTTSRPIRLDEHGIANSGVVEMKTSPILNFKDPDGIALAIAVPPSAPH